MTEQLSRLQAVVKGYVQGVGFRAHTQWQADALGLSGYARNLRGGEVEVVAEGTRENLEKLERYLRKGPPGARVSRLETTWLPAQGGFEGFTVHG